MSEIKIAYTVDPSFNVKKVPNKCALNGSVISIGFIDLGLVGPF